MACGTRYRLSWSILLKIFSQKTITSSDWNSSGRSTLLPNCESTIRLGG
ncbi:hypothetical protein [Rubritalea tangerina]